MSTAVVDVDGNVRQLDAKADAPVAVTAEDVKDVEKLARLLNDTRRELAELRRRWEPRRMIYEDLETAAGVDMRLEHGLGGRVRWWVTDWTPLAPGDAAHFETSEDTDDAALVLTAGNDGTVTIHIEAAG